MINLEENERIFLSLSKHELQYIIMDCMNACLCNPPKDYAKEKATEKAVPLMRDPCIVDFLNSTLEDSQLKLARVDSIAILLSNYLKCSEWILKDYMKLTFADLLYWAQNRKLGWLYYLSKIGNKGKNQIFEFYKNRGVLAENPLRLYMDFELIGYTKLTSE